MPETHIEVPEETQSNTLESQETPVEKDNDYLKLVNKRIRTLNKKLNIGIANIEKKVASASNINDDEQKLLANKPNILKSLKEFEELKNQMVKVQNQEERLQKRPKRRGDSKIIDENEKSEIRGVVELLHVCDYFSKLGSGRDPRKEFLVHQENLRAQQGVDTLVNSEGDIETFFHLAKFISKNDHGIDDAFDHTVKLISLSEEEVLGTTYKLIRQQLKEVVSSSVFNRKTTQEEVPIESTVNHVSQMVLSNHTPMEQGVEQLNGGEDDGEPVQEGTAEEDRKEKKDQGRPPLNLRRTRQVRGRGRGGSQAEASNIPKDNYNQQRGGRGGGNRRGGNRTSYRGANNQKSSEQSAPPS